MRERRDDRIVFFKLNFDFGYHSREYFALRPMIDYVALAIVDLEVKDLACREGEGHGISRLIADHEPCVELGVAGGRINGAVELDSSGKIGLRFHCALD